MANLREHTTHLECEALRFDQVGGAAVTHYVKVYEIPLDSIIKASI